MTTAEYLAQYIDAFVKPFRAPNTTACYERAARSLPASVKNTPLDQLTGLQLQAAINHQAKKHPRAAQLTYTTLHVAMKQAVELGILTRSPMNGCRKPIHTAARASVLTVDQLSHYIAAARSVREYPLLLLMATIGLRRGEALGLRWDRINLQTGMVLVDQQRMRVSGRYVLRPLKSRASKRLLPLPPSVLQELTTVRIRSMSGFLVDVTPETLARVHGRVLISAGLPHVTLHGLRHSMATAAAAQGCPMKILQGILGHSKYDLTANLYADHLSGDAFVPFLADLGLALLG